MDLIWRSEKKMKFGDFCHFAPIAPNFPRAKIYPNKVYLSRDNVITVSRDFVGWVLSS